MNAVLVVSLLAMQLMGSTMVKPEPAATQQPLMPKITEQMVRQAVRETLAAEAAVQTLRRHEADTLRADKYQAFATQFDEAKVPDCLHPDGLKRQPTNIGPIKIVGLYAVPFVLIAKLRGKCL
jgi:hypothetical protein